MTKDERQKIYKLLSNFYPNAKQLQDRETLTAYGLVLQRFSYNDVKEAVLQHVMRCSYFPNVKELVGDLTPEPTKADGGSDYNRYIDYVSERQPPWYLCHVLRDHSGEGLLAGEMFDRYVPGSCVGCPRCANCYEYQRRSQ